MRFIVFLLALTLSIPSFAQSTPKIKELEKQRKDALREISNTNKLLSETKKSTTTLLDRIKLISNQIFSRQKVLSLLEQEISGLDSEQKRIESEILILEAELKDKQKNYAKAIDGMLANRQSENRVLFVLSGKSLTESYRRLRYLRDYSEWRNKQTVEIKDKSAQLKERKEALAKARTEKTALLGLRSTEQENLKKEEGNYQQEVTEAQQKQKDLQKILTEKRQQAEALDRQIAKLIAEEVARQEREAKRIAEEKARAEAAKEKAAKGSSKTRSKPSITLPSQKMTSENVVLSNNFASNRGKLPYPITGNYTITTRFGTHQHSKFVTTSSSGIDIRSQAGAEAKAVFNGEVTYVAAIPGYNTCIIIRHGNYYTFYGNIQNIYIKQGDKVKTGQSLGKVFTDPDTGFSQIHFQLWQGTNKLNPEPWLR
ncbi:septal ring factor EnvC (AmiA/AmiB activator) [Dysgonomonas sp. PFB1-18]|uniref:murein hydrolase activator EnvC family protein n=1 Tax=unclassified Dysgonomonas TaxID=2630389 RepID=UPI0024732617|nr:MULTISPECIES: peptidoglycan DD-metalloendopeptidase family protein [unclassified Dysgonomonas]MDL2303651.1 peptidoglycan DD-metalloendopeptidase family protein [Dysgonomonas sp. OttesenSCG-928-D17]MDH6309000.1 septal ring factor EnvC (AmiA/AmiB activator) [Dysgonomonas sp. PF1-14]MDH6338751.1 septal ring factor EnvC (AmiA/AmiB activator) [Dysgonomonas sp. PF1-16]MDH6380221.1 septal ring factor EnvC (AmiA/AmiB activator) [Dysgonomonas sp. PFB1-18]MDH6397551.1 septal ring factor EnvC (AmiA/Am